MIFSEQILLSLGAEVLQYEMNELIFSDGHRPNYYYQVSRGAVKLTKERENGTEAILGISFSGECFAETFLFGSKAYPFNAVAMELCEIFRVPGERFVDFVKNTQESLLKLYCYNAEKMYYRYVMLNCLSINDSMLRLIELFRVLKAYYSQSEPFCFQIPFTRQQLSSITALRLETVIRTVKKMEKNKMVRIVNGKIFY